MKPEEDGEIKDHEEDWYGPMRVRAETGRASEFLGQKKKKTFLFDHARAEAFRYAFVKTHRIYSSKTDPSAGVVAQCAQHEGEFGKSQGLLFSFSAILKTLQKVTEKQENTSNVKFTFI